MDHTTRQVTHHHLATQQEHPSSDTPTGCTAWPGQHQQAGSSHTLGPAFITTKANPLPRHNKCNHTSAGGRAHHALQLQAPQEDQAIRFWPAVRCHTCHCRDSSTVSTPQDLPLPPSLRPPGMCQHPCRSLRGACEQLLINFAPGAAGPDNIPWTPLQPAHTPTGLLRIDGCRGCTEAPWLPP
jgi:hypothetical protein